MLLQEFQDSSAIYRGGGGFGGCSFRNSKILVQFINCKGGTPTRAQLLLPFTLNPPEPSLY